MCQEFLEVEMIAFACGLYLKYKGKIGVTCDSRMLVRGLDQCKDLE